MYEATIAMLVEGMHVVSVGLDSVSHWSNIFAGINHPISLDWVVFAQQVTDPDVLGRMGSAWNNFIKTGQVWALLIGLIIGYFFRSMTSF